MVKYNMEPDDMYMIYCGKFEDYFESYCREKELKKKI